MKLILKGFSFTAVLFLTLSCGGKDQICSCIEAGNQLNQKANLVLRKEPTATDEKMLIELRKKKKSACAEFETMGGPEMKERMESCI